MVANGANSAISGIANKLNGVTNIGFTTDSTSNFKGQGSASTNASFSTIVSARIVKVMENGTYFISGKREILIDKQKQILQISGVIRSYDINQYNTIDSSKIANEFGGGGHKNAAGFIFKGTYEEALKLVEGIVNRA